MCIFQPAGHKMGSMSHFQRGIKFRVSEARPLKVWMTPVKIFVLNTDLGNQTIQNHRSYTFIQPKKSGRYLLHRP